MKKRIWLVWNGTESRITLEVGKAFQIYSHHYTDEGYYSEACDITLFEDGTLSREDYYQGCDCDGPHSTERQLEADSIEDGHPQWETVSSSQRDYFAEAMGY